MTRAAVQNGFEAFLADTIEATLEEFSVARALRSASRGPGGVVVDKLLSDSDLLHRRVVQPEIEAYEQQTIEQFDRLLDAVEAETPIEDHREEILAAGTFTDNLRSDLSPKRRERVRDQLFAHHRGLGQAVKPLVESQESSFWDAASVVFSPAEAKELVEVHFAFTGPLRENRDAFAMQTTLDVQSLVGGLAGLFGGNSTYTVEYTEEAIRAMYRAEQRVIHDVTSDLDRKLEYTD